MLKKNKLLLLPFLRKNGGGKNAGGKDSITIAIFLKRRELGGPSWRHILDFKLITLKTTCELTP